MLKIMLPHFLKQLDDAQQTSDTKQSVLELEKQWILPDAARTLAEEKKIEKAQKTLRKEYFKNYLKKPIDALLADTTIKVSWKKNPETKVEEAQINRLPATEKILDHWRKELLTPKTIHECIDINQLLIMAYAAYHTYYGNSVFQTWDYNDAFAILIIGFIQSLVNPSLAKMYCENLHGVVNDYQVIHPRAKSLKLAGGRGAFYRSDLEHSPSSGLGFSFLCSIYGANEGGRDHRDPGREWGAAAIDDKDWMVLQQYVNQIHQGCRQLTEQYQAKRASKAKPQSWCLIS
jgi:hypothetical protein